MQSRNQNQEDIPEYLQILPKTKKRKNKNEHILFLSNLEEKHKSKCLDHPIRQQETVWDTRNAFQKIKDKKIPQVFTSKTLTNTSKSHIINRINFMLKRTEYITSKACVPNDDDKEAGAFWTRQTWEQTSYDACKEKGSRKVNQGNGWIIWILEDNHSLSVYWSPRRKLRQKMKPKEHKQILQ